MKKLYLLFFLLPLVLTGCSSYQKSLYLQNDTVINQSTQGQLYDFRIMPKDLLTIVVSTTDPAASAPFYRKLGQDKNNGGNSTMGMQNANLLGYLVDNNGEIDFPVLGKIQVTGLTTRECEALLREKLKPYLKENPLVTVSSSNYKFSVLGEVNAPGTYTVQDEKVTIFEAIAQAGDMTLFSIRDDVQLLREDSEEPLLLSAAERCNLRETHQGQGTHQYLQQQCIHVDNHTECTYFCHLTGTRTYPLMYSLILSFIQFFFHANRQFQPDTR